MTPPSILSAAVVEEALGVIRRFLSPTRLIASRDSFGRSVLLKLENEQPTGSFKVRGALSNLLRQNSTPSGFVAASAGNHGLGVAWAALSSERPERVTIFVPASAPETKITVDKDKASFYRLSVTDLATASHISIKGTVASKFKEDGKERLFKIKTLIVYPEQMAANQNG